MSNDIDPNLPAYLTPEGVEPDFESPSYQSEIFSGDRLVPLQDGRPVEEEEKGSPLMEAFNAANEEYDLNNPFGVQMNVLGNFGNALLGVKTENMNAIADLYQASKFAASTLLGNREGMVSSADQVLENQARGGDPVGTQAGEFFRSLLDGSYLEENGVELTTSGAEVLESARDFEETPELAGKILEYGLDIFGDPDAASDLVTLGIIGARTLPKLRAHIAADINSVLDSVLPKLEANELSDVAEARSIIAQVESGDLDNLTPQSAAALERSIDRIPIDEREQLVYGMLFDVFNNVDFSPSGYNQILDGRTYNGGGGMRYDELGNIVDARGVKVDFVDENAQITGYIKFRQPDGFYVHKMFEGSGAKVVDGNIEWTQAGTKPEWFDEMWEKGQIYLTPQGEIGMRGIFIDYLANQNPNARGPDSPAGYAMAVVRQYADLMDLPVFLYASPFSPQGVSYGQNTPNVTDLNTLMRFYSKMGYEPAFVPDIIDIYSNTASNYKVTQMMMRPPQSLVEAERIAAERANFEKYEDVWTQGVRPRAGDERVAELEQRRLNPDPPTIGNVGDVDPWEAIDVALRQAPNAYGRMYQQVIKTTDPDMTPQMKFAVMADSLFQVSANKDTAQVFHIGNTMENLMRLHGIPDAEVDTWVNNWLDATLPKVH